MMAATVSLPVLLGALLWSSAAVAPAAAACAGSQVRDPESDACIECPIGALCNEGIGQLEDLRAAPGFWRAFPNTSNFVACRPSEACAGGQLHPVVLGVDDGWPDSPKDYIQYSAREEVVMFSSDCSPGYVGPMCAVCARGFGRTLSGGCSACPSDAIVYFGAAASLLAGLLVMGFAAWVTATHAVSLQSRRMSSNTKVFLGFLNLSAFLPLFADRWPLAAAWLHSLQRVSFLAIDVAGISTECLLGTATHAAPKMFCIYAAAPLVVLAMFGVGVFAASCQQSRSKGRSRTESRMTFFADVATSRVCLVLFILYPALVQRSMAVLHCDSEVGPSFLTLDRTVSCDTFTYQSYKLMGIVSVVVYVAGIPAFFVATVVSNSSNLWMRTLSGGGGGVGLKVRASDVNNVLRIVQYTSAKLRWDAHRADPDRKLGRRRSGADVSEGEVHGGRWFIGGALNTHRLLEAGRRARRTAWLTAKFVIGAEELHDGHPDAGGGIDSAVPTRLGDGAVAAQIRRRRERDRAFKMGATRDRFDILHRALLVDLAIGGGPRALLQTDGATRTAARFFVPRSIINSEGLDALHFAAENADEAAQAFTMQAWGEGGKVTPMTRGMKSSSRNLLAQANGAGGIAAGPVGHAKRVGADSSEQHSATGEVLHTTPDIERGSSMNSLLSGSSGKSSVGSSGAGADDAVPAVEGESRKEHHLSLDGIGATNAATHPRVFALGSPGRGVRDMSRFHGGVPASVESHGSGGSLGSQGSAGSERFVGITGGKVETPPASPSVAGLASTDRGARMLLDVQFNKDASSSARSPDSAHRSGSGRSPARADYDIPGAVTPSNMPGTGEAGTASRRSSTSAKHRVPLGRIDSAASFRSSASSLDGLSAVPYVRSGRRSSVESGHGSGGLFGSALRSSAAGSAVGSRRGSQLSVAHFETVREEEELSGGNTSVLFHVVPKAEAEATSPRMLPQTSARSATSATGRRHAISHLRSGPEFLRCSRLLEWLYQDCVYRLAKEGNLTYNDVLFQLPQRLRDVYRASRRYGFAFASYTPGNENYEALTMFRKAAFAYVAVFFFGSTLAQGVLGVMIVVFALLRVFVLSPFGRFSVADPVSKYRPRYVRLMSRFVQRLLTVRTKLWDKELDDALEALVTPEADSSGMPMRHLVPEWATTGFLEKLSLFSTFLTLCLALLLSTDPTVSEVQAALEIGIVGLTVVTTLAFIVVIACDAASVIMREDEDYAGRRRALNAHDDQLRSTRKLMRAKSRRGL